ncbi:multidrug resistance protein MdtN [Vibrio aerogenes CECT 7868]|uniref:Multidrug resistance protein MdtN n=1 Tax=Vibrio aerogenes CECT 7868 TaxID=1216006 RepID=A0A1M5ZTE6_9VIBR|nr:biotin/lipoyl-binding protein [Vibrio aerogenes]SHI27193.1 multidrug resistance protein MdtN [Vibrio aerogenes CECT 7868]
MVHAGTAVADNTTETRLLSLLQLEQKARQATTLQQLQFVMLNQTRIIAEYEQAVLWDVQHQAVCGASGVLSIDRQAPLAQWLNRRCRSLIKQDVASGIHRVQVDDWPQADQQMFSQHFADVMIWLPVTDPEDRVIAVLLLSRTQPLSIREKRLLTFLQQAYGHAWQAINRQNVRLSKNIRLPQKKRLWVCGGLIAAAVMLIPVHQSVLAPAEIISSASSMVRLPVSGVVKSLHLTPNSPVKQGDHLLTLDAQRLNEQLAQARQQLAISRAELRVARQQSFYDASRKASIAVLEGRMNLARLNADYLQQQVSQTEIFAQQDGIALFDDQGDWIGRPLNLGEPVMLIADPSRTQLEVRLAVDDMMPLEAGDQVRFFPNSRPAEPIQARLTTMAYHSTLQDNGRYAFVLKAAFQSVADSGRPSQDVPQMGLKGVAKVYGRKTTLFFYLFRRPLSQLRLWWGAL